MKKVLKTALLLLGILAMLFTSACSGSSDLIPPNSAPAAQSTAEAGDDTQTSPAGEATEETAEDPAEITVAETVIYDEGGVKVTVTGYADGWLGPEITFLLENNTQQNVLITTEDLSVNGFMMPYTSLYATVAPGKKSNETITLMNSTLKQSGITTVAELQFFLEIQDADTWDTLAVTDLISLPTSAYGYEQPLDESGNVVYDQGGIRVICRGLKQDLIWDGTVVFFMTNNSGQNVNIYAENVSVNGFMENVGLWSSLRDGTHLVDGMYMMDLSDLNLDSIEQVENIEMNLRITNADTWTEIVTTDVITLDFNG